MQNKQAPTKEFGKGQKERGNASPYILLNSQDPFNWNLFLLSNAMPQGRILSQNVWPETKKLTHLL